MAMTMTGKVSLPAHRPTVWALLTDPEVLKSSIPGCESLEKTGDNGFAAIVKTKIGPVSATFKGKVELSDIVRLVGYTIKGVARAASPASLRAAQKCRSPTRRAARCCATTSRRMSAARSRSSAHTSLTASPRTWLTNFSPVSLALPRAALGRPARLSQRLNRARPPPRLSLLLNPSPRRPRRSNRRSSGALRPRPRRPGP